MPEISTLPDWFSQRVSKTTTWPSGLFSFTVAVAVRVSPTAMSPLKLSSRLRIFEPGPGRRVPISEEMRATAPAASVRFPYAGTPAASSAFR